MKKLLLIYLLFISITCFSQKINIIYIPKQEVIDTMSMDEWYNFYSTIPVIFVKLKTEKIDWIVDGYKKRGKKCYFWKYHGDKVFDNVKVSKLTYCIPCDNIARP